MSVSLELQVKTLPNEPGVYQYFDKDDIIIYVGKAKNLKKRVASYFNKNHENGKTRVLVKKIVGIKHIVVNTETDALLLENNLIKKYKPRYNVLLKDDKSYPWICIKKERFPRIFATRRVIKDGVICQYSLQLLGGQLGAISNRHLTGVNRATHSNSATVVERYPAGTRGHINHRV